LSRPVVDIRTSATTVLSHRLVACLLVGVAALAFWWARGDGPIDLHWDGGAYYLLGTSLERGDGYRILSEAGNLPSSLHPPLVPAIVALPQALVAAVPWAVLAVVVPRATIETLEIYASHHQQVSYVQHGRPISYRLFYYGPEGVDLDAALDWLDEHAAPGDVLAASDPQWAYLRTGRRTVLPPFELDGRKGQRLIDSVPVKYLIESTYLAYWRFTTPLLAANPQAWRPVWRGPNGTVVIHERVGAPQP
jgi:hypothetical protein